MLLSSVVKTSISLCPRGVTSVPAYPATEAAMNIIITGATRQSELFYPWFTYILSITKEIFPSITGYMMKNSYTYNPWKTFIVIDIFHDIKSAYKILKDKEFTILFFPRLAFVRGHVITGSQRRKLDWVCINVVNTQPEFFINWSTNAKDK